MNTCQSQYPHLSQKDCEDLVLRVANQGQLGGGKKRKSYRKKYSKKRKSMKRKSKRRKSSKRSKRRR